MMLLTAGVFYVVWMNRASEKIVTAVIPITVAALTGVSLAIFVFGGETTATARFPTVFLYRSSDKMPITPPYRPMLMSLFELPELQKDHPDLVGDGDDGWTLYHEFLQRAIIDIIARRHRFSWETEISRFDIGGTEEMSGPASSASGASQKLSFEEIRGRLEGNRFGNSRFGSPELTLPPRMRLEVTLPVHNGTNAQEGRIVFTNEFVRLSITTQAFSRMVGLGPYTQMMGYTPIEAQTQCAQAQYLVTIMAEYSRLRIGHPDMARYRRWVQQIVSELQAELDEQVLWARTKESYIFAKQIEMFSGVPVSMPPQTLNAPGYH